MSSRQNENNNHQSNENETKAAQGVKGCPKCGCVDYLPILYGFISTENYKKARKKELVIGGCCMESDPPNKQCKNCGENYLEISKNQ